MTDLDPLFASAVGALADHKYLELKEDNESLMKKYRSQNELFINLQITPSKREHQRLFHKLHHKGMHFDNVPSAEYVARWKPGLKQDGSYRYEHPTCRIALARGNLLDGRRVRYPQPRDHDGREWFYKEVNHYKRIELTPVESPFFNTDELSPYVLRHEQYSDMFQFEVRLGSPDGPVLTRTHVGTDDLCSLHPLEEEYYQADGVSAWFNCHCAQTLDGTIDGGNRIDFAGVAGERVCPFVGGSAGNRYSICHMTAKLVPTTEGMFPPMDPTTLGEKLNEFCESEEHPYHGSLEGYTAWHHHPFLKNYQMSFHSILVGIVGDDAMNDGDSPPSSGASLDSYFHRQDSE